MERGNHGRDDLQTLSGNGLRQERNCAKAATLSVQACSCNFTKTKPRGKPAAMKALALILYAMGNMSFCSIGRFLGVSDVAVLRWVRGEARRLPEPAMPAETVVINLDEMYHFMKKRHARYGFGERLTLSLGELAWVLGRRDDATCQKLLDKVGLKGKHIPHRRLGRLSSSHPRRPALHRQGSDLLHRAG